MKRKAKKNRFITDKIEEIIYSWAIVIAAVF